MMAYRALSGASRIALCWIFALVLCLLAISVLFDCPATPGDVIAYPYLFPVSINKRFGYIDASGKVRIKTQFVQADEFSEGFAAVRFSTRPDSTGYIDISGRTIIPPQFGYAGPFSRGFAAVSVGNKWGVIDRTGGWIVKPQFERVQKPVDGMCVYRAGKKYGYINCRSKTAIPTLFDSASDFSEGVGRVGSWKSFQFVRSFVDENGRSVLDLPGYSFVGDFSEGLAEVVRDSKCGYINHQGKLVTRLQRNDIVGSASFHDGLAVLVVPKRFGVVELVGKKFGFTNKSGEVAVEPCYDHALPFSEGLAKVSLGSGGGYGGKQGYIDKTGKRCIPLTFDNASSFSEGMAAVCVGHKWGFIDRSGTVKVSPQFEFVSDFKHGLAQFIRFSKGISGYVNKNGIIVWEDS